MQINRQNGMTMIIVSHDIHSTMRMADRILLLLNGRAIEGTPQELRDSRDPAAAEFFNEGLGKPEYGCLRPCSGSRRGALMATRSHKSGFARCGSFRNWARWRRLPSM